MLTLPFSLVTIVSRAEFDLLSDYNFKNAMSCVLPTDEFKYSYFQFLDYSSMEEHWAWILEESFPTFKVAFEMGDLRLLYFWYQLVFILKVISYQVCF